MTDSSEGEILAEVEGLFRAAFALESWGRMLVFLVPDPRPGKSEAFVVGDVQVEGVTDDAAVDRAFASNDVRAALPAVAAAVSTLTMLAGARVGDVGGGTFLRVDRGGAMETKLAFLPGPVRTPSRSFDARREAAVRETARANRELCAKLGVDDLDGMRCDTETCRFAVDAAGGPATGKAIVIGSFSRPRCSWVWGAHNPTLAEVSRRESSALLDHASDRSMWEISTPGFHTDEATAWALAATLVVDRKLEGLVRVEQSEGFLAVAVAEVVTGRANRADP